MENKNIIHWEPKKRLPNPMHLEVQLTTRAHIFKPKKGKGSFKRKEKYNNYY